MSIFVLNLATLLGLGPGGRLLAAHDQPLPRGAGAPRRTHAGRRRRGRPDHRRDGRAGGLLQRPDRPPRAARPGPVRVHDPALGRHRRGHRRGPRRGRRADPAAGRADRASVRTSTASPCARSRAAPGQDGPWARLARRVMRHPVAVLVPTLAFLLVLGVAVPARPLQRARLERAARPTSRRARPSTGCSDEFGEGEFAPIALAVRTTGPATDPANLAALYDYSRRLAADPRVTRVDSLVDVDPRLTLRPVPAPVRRPQRPARPVRGDGPGGHDPRRPDRVQRHDAVRPEPRRGPRRSSPTCATPTDRSPRRPG